jgi:ubiquinone/menaquinone biosynthesis C-methylase UbiE
MNDYKKEWNQSYQRKENYLFYPNEDVIRFFQKYIKKSSINNKKVLDLGCGVGRHINFFIENGYYPIGVDISNIALKACKSILNSKGYKIKKDFFLIENKKNQLPISSNSIYCLIANASLDSMPTYLIKNMIEEMYRVLKTNRFGFVSLISGSVNNRRKGKFIGKYDQIVSEKHENKTVQSYFNYKRILSLFKKFEITEIYKNNKIIKKTIVDSRYCVVIKKIS